MKILLCGDSFSADYTIRDKHVMGWPNMLARDHDLKNVSDAGASEYRIWRQVRDNLDTNFDVIIISHTSPNRIYVESHPIHQDELHKNCDLIYNDIQGRGLTYIEEWFRKCFSVEHAKDIHHLLINDIVRMTQGYRVVHLGHLDIDAPKELSYINLNKTWLSHRGGVNHYDEEGNRIVYEHLATLL